MKKLAALSLAMVQLGLAAPSIARADESWKLVQEKDGVRFSRRHVTFSPVDEVFAESVLEFPADIILSILTDVEHYPANMPPTLIARRLRGAADDSTYYMELKPPMSTRRYYCTRYVVKHLPGGVLRAEWSTVNDASCPSAPKMIRMEDNAGAWTLTPVSTGKTRVTYQAHVDPGGAIPASLINWVTPSAITDLFRSLRKSTTRAQLTATRN